MENDSVVVKRPLDEILAAKLGKGKAIILMGPRQAGNTLLRILFQNSGDALLLNGDEPDVQVMFENMSSIRLKAMIGNKKVVIIDEAQRIADIGLRLKLITDQLSEVRLVATGSSSFDLANKVNEPLTGRKWGIRCIRYASKKWLTITDCSKKNDLFLIGGIWLLPRCCNEHRRRKRYLKAIIRQLSI